MSNKGTPKTLEHRAKIRAAAVSRYADPDSPTRLRQRETMRRRWADPALRLREKRAARIGAAAPGWRGGQIVKRGYVFLYAPDHPRGRRYKDHYVKRSWLVVEARLGRHLAASEVVHHINGVRDDDRPENLVVMQRGVHQRLHEQERRQRRQPH